MKFNDGIKIIINFDGKTYSKCLLMSDTSILVSNDPMNELAYFIQRASKEIFQDIKHDKKLVGAV